MSENSKAIWSKIITAALAFLGAVAGAVFGH